ncbi:glycosyltransferase [Rhizobiaceae bacterium n13]|uniref:Glycosyltransferase n=1 Tax=Ferirhizobium litorale TaxID=2927786 RepID=A0AAE3U3Y4_9HYPH|nr:glycosyltransferase family 2 protein [Fererhizobium litorale]MDI7862272.1 glycosyltransferase [Fererhizobium litorale]MDI7922454.1 glycosyltransferase [Fererhizobium litorale]
MQIGEYVDSLALDGGGSHADAETTLWDPADEPAQMASGPLLADGPGRGERQILRELGIGKLLIAGMAERAALNGTTIEQELLCHGSIDEDTYYAALARHLRLPYIRAIDASRVIVIPGTDNQLVRPTVIRLAHPVRVPRTVIVPEARLVPRLEKQLASHPVLRGSLAVGAATKVRNAVWQAHESRRVEAVVRLLFEWQPRFSARIVFWGRQGFYAGAALTATAMALLLATSSATLALHVFLTHLYFASLLFRTIGVFHRRRGQHTVALPPADTPDLPVYTVMVALYREAAVASQLIRMLDRLNWPRAKLDIKLVCEADDQETIEALKAQRPGRHFEIIEVPPMQPRTKPKALAYALAGARGPYVAIYDAEDRPHPDQLREAYTRFSRAPEDVACLQAPLVISNAGDSWISTMFALEYSALFRGLLPMLSRYRMPLPLGGTSNHFRLSALKASGAWDPFNVTEDADLGMRLYRLGYRSETIGRQTLEDAPTGVKVWMGQRTRWFKGWLQTWLVMMREPGQLRREMGLPAFLIFQMQIGGMLVSSLAHPLILLFLANSIAAMMASPDDGLSAVKLWLFTVDCINILGSWAMFLALGAIPMIEYEKRLLGWRWILVPVYWLMVSTAAWRAMLELRFKPFFWNKTPHQPTVNKR